MAKKKSTKAKNKPTITTLSGQLQGRGGAKQPEQIARESRAGIRKNLRKTKKK